MNVPMPRSAIGMAGTGADDGGLGKASAEDAPGATAHPIGH